MTINGACYCGTVRYQIDGDLYGTASCHCSMCRKLFGAQASAYSLFEPENFTWLDGEDSLSQFDCGNELGVQFCSQCGSTLGGTYQGKPAWISLGCIEGDHPEIKLGKHQFVGSKASWEMLPDDGVPRYEEMAPEDN